MHCIGVHILYQAVTIVVIFALYCMHYLHQQTVIGTIPDHLSRISCLTEVTCKHLSQQLSLILLYKRSCQQSNIIVYRLFRPWNLYSLFFAIPISLLWPFRYTPRMARNLYIVYPHIENFNILCFIIILDPIQVVLCRPYHKLYHKILILFDTLYLNPWLPLS